MKSSNKNINKLSVDALQKLKEEKMREITRISLAIQSKPVENIPKQLLETLKNEFSEISRKDIKIKLPAEVIVDCNLSWSSPDSNKCFVFLEMSNAVCKIGKRKAYFNNDNYDLEEPSDAFLKTNCSPETYKLIVDYNLQIKQFQNKIRNIAKNYDIDEYSLWNLLDNNCYD